MRALIIALDRSVDHYSERLAPPFLLPLIDRPFVQHVVERLIDAGITEFDMLVDERTSGIGALFGTGARWGSSIRYHEVPDSRGAVARLKALTSANPDEAVLMMTADALPDFESDDLASLMGGLRRLCYSYREATESSARSGWAILDGRFLASLPNNATLNSIGQELQRSGEIGVRSYLLHAATYAELLEAQKHLNHDRVARSARVHPTATIVGPVFLGDNVRVERGARLGPNVVVGANSVIGADTRIRNSQVCPKTYVGEGLEIDHMILDGEALFHAALSASVTVREPMFLSRLSR